MHPRFLIITAIVFNFLSAPIAAQEEEEEASEPLQVLITPYPKDRFDGTFDPGSGVSAPRVNQRFTCPFYDELVCDVTAGFPSLRDEGRIDNVVRGVVANLVYEIQRENHDSPDLGLIMGKNYHGLPDYVIMASLGIDPKLHEDAWFTGEGPNDGIYGGLWLADTLSLGDRMGGPIILTRFMPQIDRLTPKPVKKTKKSDFWDYVSFGDDDNF